MKLCCVVWQGRTLRHEIRRDLLGTGKQIEVEYAFADGRDSMESSIASRIADAGKGWVVLGLAWCCSFRSREAGQHDAAGVERIAGSRRHRSGQLKGRARLALRAPAYTRKPTVTLGPLERCSSPRPSRTTSSTPNRPISATPRCVDMPMILHRHLRRPHRASFISRLTPPSPPNPSPTIQPLHVIRMSSHRHVKERI